jgi:hypothetical protein
MSSVYVPSQDGDFLTEQQGEKIFQRRGNYINLIPPIDSISLIKSNENGTWESNILEENQSNKILYYDTVTNNISYGDNQSSFDLKFSFPSLNSSDGRLGKIESSLQSFKKYYKPNTFGINEMALFIRPVGGLILQPSLLNIRINTRDLSYPNTTTVFIEIGHCGPAYSDQVFLKQTNEVNLTSFFSPSGFTQYYADINSIEVPQIILSPDRFFYVKVFYNFQTLPSSGSVTTGQDFTSSTFFTKIEEIPLYGNPLPYGVSQNLFLSYRNNGWTGAGDSSVNIGLGSSQNYNNQSISIGLQSGQNNQGTGSIALGYRAGRNNQRTGAIAIGYQAGESNQSTGSIAIGLNAGNNNQGFGAIAIGRESGFTGQLFDAVAIGRETGFIDQREGGIAIGPLAGRNIQGINAIAIGQNAGFTGQGQNSIAIGQNAGYTNQHTNSIILNASGNILNSQTQSALYVNPIRNISPSLNTNVNGSLLYNTSSREISYEIPVCFSAYKTVTQNYNTPSSITKVTFDTKAFDTKGYYNTTDSEFRPLIGGYYQINCGVSITPTNASRVYVSLFKNNAEIHRGDNDVNSSSFITGRTMSLNALVVMNGTTDYLDVRVFSNISGTLETGQVFQYFQGFLLK